MDVIRSKRKSKYGQIALTFIVGIGLAWLVIRGGADPTPIIDITTTKVGIVRQQEFNIEVSASGHLSTKNSGAVIAKEGGLVTKRIISNGDAVRKGDLLFEIDNPELITKFHEAQEEYDNQKSSSEFERLQMVKEHERIKGDLVKARLELKNKEFEKNAKEVLSTMENPSVSKMEYQKVLMEYEMALSTYKSSQIILAAFEKSKRAKEQELNNKERFHEDRVERLKASIAALKVLAAHDGVVQDVVVDEGERVQELGLLCRIPNSQEMYVTAQVPAFDIEKIDVGQRATVFVNQKFFDAVVSRIDPLVKESLVTVDLSLVDFKDEYRVNTPVRVSILAASKAKAVTVDRPVNARENSKSFVYAVNGQIAERTEVLFGVGTLSKIEVISGLEVGQKIIISDIAGSVRSASKVRIK